MKWLALLILLILLFPQTSRAEIATIRDWIGLFAVNSSHNKADTLYGTSWKYTSSCTQTPTPIPRVESGTDINSGLCDFSLNPTPNPGAYEFRLYANDQEGTEALLAQSKVMWKAFDFRPESNCIKNSSSYSVTLSWPYLAGVDYLTIRRTSGAQVKNFNLSPYNTSGPNSFTDTIVNPTLPATYDYYLIANNSRDSFGSTHLAHVGINEVACSVDTTTLVPTPTSTPTAPTPTPLNNPTPTPMNFACPTSDSNIRLEPGSMGEGFLTLGDPSRINTFKVSGRCLITNKAMIPQFSIPTYEDMESIYYTQNKSTQVSKIPLTGDKTDADISSALNNECTQPNCLIQVNGNLTIQNNFTATLNKPAVIFVKNILDINTGSLTHTSNTAGLVFVVGGNVNINTAVSQIDAFIITNGVFCSAWNGNACDTDYDGQLAVNGSVISLNSAAAPIFGRINGNNQDPGEVITYQPKYLVILKDIFSRDLTVWNEIQ